MKQFGNKIGHFFKAETVLAVAAVLAAISVFFVKPDRGYIDYVDVRTLALLFCLMYVMAGFQRLGLFRSIAEGLLRKVGTDSVRVVLVLMSLCFFFAMLITNDVALITFVPFTLTLLDLMGKERREKLIVPVIVLETLAANLGSMMTPIGNPQNLYLYGKSGMSLGAFILFMLPLSLLALVFLGVEGILIGKSCRGTEEMQISENTEALLPVSGKETGKMQGTQAAKIFLLLYAGLFVLSLLTVADVLIYQVVLGITLVAAILLDRQTLKNVDYGLLATFVAFFIFIGNMGRLPFFASALERMVTGHEVLVSVLASQAISNVPAALLLSGFTENIPALIVGVNLGGMGTLIASMASLISYKYVAKLEPDKKGKYFRHFTAANICFLVLLVLGYLCGKTMGLYT